MDTYYPDTAQVSQIPHPAASRPARAWGTKKSLEYGIYPPSAQDIKPHFFLKRECQGSNRSNNGFAHYASL